ncbi:hypothetical protein C2845_PM02G31280 [Panicum miliaceum]|uniref:Uncharacterized protein n=1 Tax=Panicum miliaceum TaxID=4540 RepID=A0A3L6S5W9_PANMI|nr:hypothetical protein C2845_PM02G31280 [Panicum miliaceum]
METRPIECSPSCQLLPMGRCRLMLSRLGSPGSKCVGVSASGEAGDTGYRCSSGHIDMKGSFSSSRPVEPQFREDKDIKRLNLLLITGNTLLCKPVAVQQAIASVTAIHQSTSVINL